MEEENTREVASSLTYTVDIKRLQVESVGSTRRRECCTGRRDETVWVVVVNTHTSKLNESLISSGDQ